MTYLTQNSTVSLQVTGYNASFWLRMLKRLGDDEKMFLVLRAWYLEFLRQLSCLYICKQRNDKLFSPCGPWSQPLCMRPPPLLPACSYSVRVSLLHVLIFPLISFISCFPPPSSALSVVYNEHVIRSLSSNVIRQGRVPVNIALSLKVDLLIKSINLLLAMTQHSLLSTPRTFSKSLLVHFYILSFGRSGVHCLGDSWSVVTLGILQAALL